MWLGFIDLLCCDVFRVNINLSKYCWYSEKTKSAAVSSSSQPSAVEAKPRTEAVAEVKPEPEAEIVADIKTEDDEV